MRDNDPMGLPIHTDPLVPARMPNVTFDPKRKCTWASEAYRAETNAWLLHRFGARPVAYMFDTRRVFGFGGNVVFIHPATAALLKADLP